MRVGFFTDSYFPGIDGVTYTLRLWTEELERHGYEVHIVYPDGDYVSGEREVPVPSVPNPFYRGYRIPLFRRLSSLPDLDVVHCHGPASIGILGRYYAKKHDLPAIYTHHTPLEEYFQQSLGSKRLAEYLEDLYLPWENAFLSTFDVVTASTTRIDRDVDHITMPVGIDMDFFRPSETIWSGDLDRPLIGYCGRLSREKNVDELLNVADREEYLVVIVGEGPCRSELERTAPDNVVFSDFLPRELLPDFYSCLDVFVTASTGDTLGLSTLEANACGTAVAAADVPPFDETIGMNNGTRFELGDVDDMVSSIEDCLETGRDTRAAVGSYSVRHTLDILDTIYRDVARVEGPPRKPPQRRPMVTNPGRRVSEEVAPVAVDRIGETRIGNR